MKKKEGKIEKREKEMRKKKENCRDFVYFLCTSVFLVSIYTFQIALFVMQPGSVVHWRTTEGLTPVTALRPCRKQLMHQGGARVLLTFTLFYLFSSSFITVWPIKYNSTRCVTATLTQLPCPTSLPNSCVSVWTTEKSRIAETQFSWRYLFS